MKVEFWVEERKNAFVEYGREWILFAKMETPTAPSEFDLEEQK